MDNIKNDEYYISKVIENIDVIIKYTKNKSFDEFINDGLLLDATMFRLVQMVENLNHISQEFRDKHQDIKLGIIIGFCNGIVYEYDKTDYNIVFEIVSKDILELKDVFECVTNKTQK